MKKLIGGLILGVATGTVALSASAGDITEKLQALVTELSAEQQAALLLLIENSGGDTAAMTPEEAARAALEAMGAAVTEGDLDTVMTYFSEDFEHYEYGDKAGWRQFQQDAMDQGYWDGIEVDGSDAEVKVDGDTASVYPVTVNGAFGTLTFEYILKNEDGTWRVIEFDVSGI